LSSATLTPILNAKYIRLSGHLRPVGYFWYIEMPTFAGAKGDKGEPGEKGKRGLIGFIGYKGEQGNVVSAADISDETCFAR